MSHRAKHRSRSRSRSPDRRRRRQSPSDYHRHRSNDDDSHVSRRRSSNELRTDVSRREDDTKERPNEDNSKLPVDQENNKTKTSGSDKKPSESQNSEGSEAKTALFPSGDNSINRDKAKFRHRQNREDRDFRTGRSRLRDRFHKRDREPPDEQFRSRGKSDGILSKEYEEQVQGRRRFGLDEPPKPPRSGYYFEHDDRDAPQPNRVRDRIVTRSPERWGASQSVGRQSHRSDGRREYRDGYRDRRPNWDRGRDRVNRPQRSHGRRERSPGLWKHDMFDTINHSPEPEDSNMSEQPPKLNSECIEQGIDDFNIDDLLMMDNPIETVELDV